MNNHIVEVWVEASKTNKRYYFFDKYPLDKRLYRLFAVACCREIWDKLTDERSREAVEVAELYADGLTSKDELEKAHDEAWNAWCVASDFLYNRLSPNDTFNASIVYCIAWAARAANESTLDAACGWIAATRASNAPQKQKHKRQGLILAQMCPTTFDDNWINTTTKSLAHNIYNNKDFSLMPILADALQDVDCNEEILNHLRSPGPFYKGNYIIDKLIGKRS